MELHPDIIKAYKKAKELQEKVNQNSDEYTKAPSGMRGAASRGERKVGKAINKHFPKASLEDKVNIRRALQEHENPYWNKK